MMDYSFVLLLITLYSLNGCNILKPIPYIRTIGLTTCFKLSTANLKDFDKQ